MHPLLLLSVFLTVAASSPLQESKQEKPPVPKDSIELTVIGCLKGRVLSTVANRQADTESSPFVGQRSFRLAGKKDVMDEVKKHHGHLVEVVGLIKRSALDDKGVKVGPATISPALPSNRLPNPADNVDVMDVSAVRLRSTDCR
jgi:hypothetical protein